MPTYEGRLELTWTNKPLRLLAHEDGRYEWVPPTDYRVAEVRLLHDAGTMGEVHGTCDRAKDNLLIRGDALNALTSLIELPEFEREYVGKVKLAYLDPPFNTQQSFLHYDDALEHSVWLTMMRDRVVQVRELLAPDGSLYVHCDATEGHYLKVLLDEVFGRANFRNEIVWKRATTVKGNFGQGSKVWGVATEAILFYTKGEDYTFNQPFTGYSDAYVDTAYRYVEPETGRRYRLVSMIGPGGKAKGNPEYEVMGVTRYWRYSRQAMDDLMRRGLIVQTKPGAVPARKYYLDEGKGVPVQSLWDDIGNLQASDVERAGYATQKPEALIERIVAASSEPGDIVLDCFLGSGTTAAVAHKMARRWVGVEWSRDAVENYVTPRLTNVVGGRDTAGISERVGWRGGGGFRILNVAPSMFEVVDGQVFLSEWATNGKLAEVTAAQLHYDYEYAPPFAGRRGRSRLSVIDGLVNDAVVQLVVSALPEDERVVICGTAIDPDAKAALRKLRPGSTVRKIPHSILQEYRQAARWTQRSLFAEVPSNGAHIREGEAAPA